MPPSKNELAARAAAAVAAAGQNWDRLLDEAAEIVVFGSTAAGLDGPSSDVDLLAIGPAGSRKTRRLDLLAQAPQKIWTPDWLGSELAGHISAYGVWLKGDGLWVPQVRVGDAAIARKRARIGRLIAAAQRHWPRLDAGFRRRSLVTIRRELQRALLLEHSVPIPPTPQLDAKFEAGEFDQRLPGLLSELPSEIVREFDPSNALG